MVKIPKIWLTVIIAMLCCVCLSACDDRGGDDIPEPASPPQSAAPIQSTPDQAPVAGTNDPMGGNDPITGEPSPPVDSSGAAGGSQSSGQDTEPPDEDNGLQPTGPTGTGGMN